MQSLPPSVPSESVSQESHDLILRSWQRQNKRRQFMRQRLGRLTWRSAQEQFVSLSAPGCMPFCLTCLYYAAEPWFVCAPNPQGPSAPTCRDWREIQPS
ncbi:hypothetical protein [Leptolyngbya sp. FACHB-261]|uniref:hypothetical protein n=1 Tax=Leptolyngbya sp. FACHB-261 TaxID=2692806 RepID=UPI001682A811|nr:hypothetical protein [Leptolyngbya sp. FACHB-261]MBD2104411.1 hypothetical protein [Leptolyngbya sp. FACHB-261]